VKFRLREVVRVKGATQHFSPDVSKVFVLLLPSVQLSHL